MRRPHCLGWSSGPASLMPEQHPCKHESRPHHLVFANESYGQRRPDFRRSRRSLRQSNTTLMALQRVWTLFVRNCGHFSRFWRGKGGHRAKTAIDVGHLGERSYRRIKTFPTKRFTPARHAGGHWFKSSTAHFHNSQPEQGFHQSISKRRICGDLLGLTR